jgi:hypothetical protein
MLLLTVWPRCFDFFTEQLEKPQDVPHIFRTNNKVFAIYQRQSGQENADTQDMLTAGWTVN